MPRSEVTGHNLMLCASVESEVKLSFVFSYPGDISLQV